MSLHPISLRGLIAALFVGVLTLASAPALAEPSQRSIDRARGVLDARAAGVAVLSYLHTGAPYNGHDYVRTDTVRDRRQSDVWMTSWDGSRTVRLTSSPESEHGAQWSPDGRWLAFPALDPRRDDAPVWSPNSTKIIFADNSGGNMDLYEKNADNSGEERLLQVVVHSAGDRSIGLVVERILDIVEKVVRIQRPSP